MLPAVLAGTMTRMAKVVKCWRMKETLLPATIKGKVSRYKGNGRKFNYPTANINTETDLTDGVYFGFADMDDFKHHPTVIFIGTPTTVGDTERRVEAHLLDIADKDYYGKQLELSVEHFHRPNETFDSVDKLLEVMRDDDAKARDWFLGEDVA